MVLCDGRMFHIYDRDQDLVVPLVKVDVSNLVRDFDLLRKYLSPWQAWFFQKRRLINLVDKVFDQEISLQRLEDFRELIDRRLGGKRNAVLDRQREYAKSNPILFCKKRISKPVSIDFVLSGNILSIGNDDGGYAPKAPGTIGLISKVNWVK